jgi:hypothetical protein
MQGLIPIVMEVVADLELRVKKVEVIGIAGSCETRSAARTLSEVGNQGRRRSCWCSIQHDPPSPACIGYPCSPFSFSPTHSPPHLFLTSDS